MSKLDAVPTEGQRILVVDDELDIREALQDLLEVSLPGVEVLLAANGQQGLEVLDEQSVDCIISDYKMPGMDGLTFLRAAMEKAPDVPRILITAFPQLSLAMDAINDAAIQNFFTKPLQPSKVEEAVRAALVKARMRRQRMQHFADRVRPGHHGDGPF